MSDGPESIEELQSERSNVRSEESVSPSALTSGSMSPTSEPRTFRSSYHAETHNDAVARRDALMPELCERIAHGELVSATAADLHIPLTILKRWAASPEWRSEYARAREAQADVLAESVITVGLAATPETAQVAKLQCDNLRWLAGKVAPRTYGDKVQVEHKAVDVSVLTDAQLEQLAKGDVSVLDSQTLPHPQTRALPSSVPADRSDSR